MDKNSILQKMEEIRNEFQQLEQKKVSLQQEIIKCEQEAYRIDGKYIAYNTILQELEAAENVEAENVEAENEEVEK